MTSDPRGAHIYGGETLYDDDSCTTSSDRITGLHTSTPKTSGYKTYRAYFDATDQGVDNDPLTMVLFSSRNEETIVFRG